MPTSITVVMPDGKIYTASIFTEVIPPTAEQIEEVFTPAVTPAE